MKDREYDVLSLALATAVETVRERYDLDADTVILAHLNGVAKALATHINTDPAKREEFTALTCDLLRTSVDFFLTVSRDPESNLGTNVVRLPVA